MGISICPGRMHSKKDALCCILLGLFRQKASKMEMPEYSSALNRRP